MLPYAEFTPDDGTWVVDAWLRLKEGDYFNLWIASSQQINNLPLVSWLFTIPLRISPTILSIQIFIIGFQLVTLLLIKKISETLDLKYYGLLVGTMFVLLPALTLNYSGRVCNPSFMVFASAFVLWTRFCNEGLKQKILLVISLIIAIQIHYAFIFYVIYFMGELFLARLIKSQFDKWLQYIYWGSTLLLGAVFLDVFNLPHLRSLTDITQSTADYMVHRNLPLESEKIRTAFLPWEMLPLLIPFFGMSIGKQKKELLQFWLMSLLFLLILGFFKSWSPHQWMLPWVLPYLLLLAIGLSQLENYKYGKIFSGIFASFLMLSCVFSFYRAFDVIRETKGVAWHGSNLETKRKVLDFIAGNYPAHQIYIASPQAFSNIATNPRLIFEKQMGYVALVTLPGEYRNKVSLGGAGGASRSVFIEESETHGGFKKFAELIAKPRGLTQVFQYGAVNVWEGPVPVDTEYWPRIAPMERRVR